ncbi:MAG: hypothetical protein ACYS9C_09280 [Planctomycetota bacterium]|jgi:hypothetical protein
MVSACPHCGQRLRINGNFVGRPAICPACKQRFKIEKASSKAERVQEAAATPPKTAQAATPSSTTQALPVRSASDFRTAGRTAPLPLTETGTHRPASTNDAGLPPKGEALPEGLKSDLAPPPLPRSSKASAKKRVRQIAIITSCVVSAIAVVAVVYLYPKTQGPPIVYVVPHVDDIDGGIDPEWFFFYDQLTRWHDRNSIPGSFAFYPGTMNSPEFNQIIADMYTSKNVELVLKGEDEYQGQKLDQMSFSEAQQALEAWQNKFITELEGLGYSDIDVPVSYNQLMMSFTETIRDAAHAVGFKICLELKDSEHGYISMLPDFDITQYSVSLTNSGQAGPDEDFKEPEQAIQELLDFYNDHLLYINGIKVVPLLCHQQDFRISEESSEINKEKFGIYTSFLTTAEDDPRIQLLKAEEVYDLRHGSGQLSIQSYKN